MAQKRPLPSSKSGWCILALLVASSSITSIPLFVSSFSTVTAPESNVHLSKFNAVGVVGGIGRVGVIGGISRIRGVSDGVINGDSRFARISGRYSIRSFSTSMSLSKRFNNNVEHNNDSSSDVLRPIASALATLSIASTLLLSPSNLPGNSFLPAAASAYEESDYASETVTKVIQQLKDTEGDVDGTFRTLEEVAAIITEGKGVGGSLSYSGVKLNQGYIADEDTTIYNPGLTLLTSSEKERLVSSLVQNRKIGISTSHWSENNEYAFDFLKQKLDPLHMYELEGYLKIFPFWGGAMYLVALFVQRNAREVFPLVYGVCALAVFGPVVLLVANGP